MELLRACLSPAQRAQMQRGYYFEVTGSAGGRYRIYTGSGVSGNVHRMLDFGDRSHCAHGRMPMPDADHFLLQKLTIEADEPLFLRTAYG